MGILVFFTIAAMIFLNSPTTRTHSFTVDYIHRDSPLSPYHNSSQTQYERLHATILRNIAAPRHRFRSRPHDLDIESKVVSNDGVFLMCISLGTPPLEILAVADTGSDLIWTDCKPCKKCYAQSSPLFDPKLSSTFQKVSCHTKICRDSSFTCSPQNKCSYNYSYGDGSKTEGVVASETITFSSSNGENISIPNINVGCSHHSQGTFQSNIDGIIGLGDGPLSLISQLGSKIDNKFSYCFVPYSNQKALSKLTFGPNHNVARLASLKIPLKPYYYLQLESLSIGDTYVYMPAEISSRRNGNILIDSGTTLTLLPTSLFTRLSSAISRMITLRPAKDPFGELQFCYHVGEGIWGDGLPDLNLNFENGVVVTLPPLNTFLKVSDSILCLAMSDTDETSILGNVAQQNFLIEFDLRNRVLSLAPTDCEHQL